MNLLETPPVPTLSDSRLSTRQEHLVQEVAGRRRNRRRAGLRWAAVPLSWVASRRPCSSWPVRAPPTCLRPGRHRRRRQRPARYRAPKRPARLRQPHRHRTRQRDWPRRDPSVARRHSRTLHTGLVRCKHIYHPHVCERPVDQFQRKANSQMRSIGSQPVLPEAGQIAVDRLQAELPATVRPTRSPKVRSAPRDGHVRWC